MRSYLPVWLVGLCLLFAVAAWFALRFPGVPGAEVGSYVSTVLIALPAVGAFVRRFRLRTAVVALGALSVFGFAVEATGVATGFPYGPFTYGDRLGPKLAGLVPWLLPVSWAPLVLGAVAATEPGRDRYSRLARVGGVLRAALLLTAIDGVLDPGAARMGFWIWPQGGAYYGVPLSNYGGWLLSSAVATALLLALAPWPRTRPAPGMLDSAIVALAFWSAVAAITGLWFPALLGLGLFALMAHRRRALAERRGAEGEISGMESGSSARSAGTAV
jgi:putative membrane protein